MSLPDEGNTAAIKDSGRFKRSTYVGVGSFTSQTLIEYAPNGKKAGTKSAERYNVYAEAKTIEQALSLGSRVADFLNDFEKGLLRPVGGCREPCEEVSAEQFVAMSKLDQTLYNFACKGRGDARLGKSSKAKATKDDESFVLEATAVEPEEEDAVSKCQRTNQCLKNPNCERGFKHSGGRCRIRKK